MVPSKDGVLRKRFGAGGRKRRHYASALLCAASATGLAYFGLTAMAGASAGHAKTKPTLTIVSAATCTNEDTGQNGLTTDGPLAYEPIIRYESKGQYLPGLATSWRVFPGNKKILLKLRHDARFSDGSAVTAKAVKTWLEYADNATGTERFWLGELASIKVTGKYSLVVNLVKPNPNIPYALTINQGEVESPSAIAKAKANPTNDWLSSHTDGAGMYVLSQFSSGNSCTYVPNKYYYNQSAIKWSKITWKTVTSSASSLAALQSGQAQVWYAADPSFASQAAADGLNVVVGKGSGGAGGSLGIEFFDHGKINPALGSVKVRQALNYAVNRNAIVQGLFNGKYCTASDLPNYGSDGDNPKYNNYYAYNPAKAKQLLAEAGYPHGFKFSIIVDSASGIGNGVGLAQAIAGYLAKVGVTMQVNVEPGGAFATAESSKKYEGWLDTLGPIPMYTWYLLVMVPNGPVADQHGWSDPVVDSLWAKGSIQKGKAAKATWVAMSDRIVTQAEELPVCAQAGIIVASKHVGGITSTSHRQGYENAAYDWFYK